MKKIIGIVFITTLCMESMYFFVPGKPCFAPSSQMSFAPPAEVIEMETYIEKSVLENPIAYEQIESIRTQTRWEMIGIFAAVLFIFGCALFVGRKLSLRFLRREKPKKQLARDIFRKEEITRIRHALSAYYKMNHHYPDSQRMEFQAFLSSIEPVPKDPLEGTKTGYKNQQYNIYYDNSMVSQSTGEIRSNTQGYRLWCFLENPSDPEIDMHYKTEFHWLYLRTHRDPL